MKTNQNLLTLLALPLFAGLLTTSAYANILVYNAVLSGPNESPANASPGTGFAEVDYDNILHTLRIQVTFSGLSGTTTASHIHAPTAVAGTGTANVATTSPTFPSFPLGVTSGTYDHTLDLTLATSYNAPFLAGPGGGTTAGAELALTSDIALGEAYLNIHSSAFGGGEIRGFLTLVPEPSSLALIGLGAGALALRRRMRNQH